ncbi:acetyl-coenzyme A synthetase [Marinicauda pacifica]|uniref:Acetyl-coenzyme A synthetase n=1 Tax=Marinicauda pacifica TaxID=1133559 RepID=A0A4S2HA44_9PROT|nr:acetate--CoA ligase [Marinicauda pacifica]TGY92431.1 acetate--CoA ligase [Marinicauda pacifica]GGE48871.1 acetyl-coenzyme A synthetase [Marinicauda pacifica]
MANDTVKIPDSFSDARITPDTYRQMYERSIQDPQGFWADEARRLDWIAAPAKISDVSFDKDDLHIRWFEDGVLNACVNCIDRHLETRGNKTALIWEGDNPAYHHAITYRQLFNHVCRFANELKLIGVKKGDRVTIHMPMIPEAVYAMLACARLGAVHSVVFGGFSPDAIAGRIDDCGSDFVITADQGVRGGKGIPLKDNVDRAIERANHEVRGVLVVKHTGAQVDFVAGRDHWHHELALEVDARCEAEPMKAEDPLFILYTSGSTGKPKGVLHTTGGYMVWAAMTHDYTFDHREEDVFWCTADVGWVTGHTYIVYGPLANGATSLMFEGVPTWPGPDRFWRVVAKHRVTTLYTAPTAIRALMREGDEPVKKHDRSSLRLLGSVGEPINPEAWRWYHEVVGEGRCPIVDTWWQTETGGHLITALPGAHALKPGAASFPMFGIQPALVDNEGNRLPDEGEQEGNLVLLGSWPGQMRTVYGDHQRFYETYFATYPGTYFTGDGARRDADGYWWITGRVDDVLNISGHRLGTAEVESALVAHDLVAEAAVVGYPHEVKGQGIYCYVTLNSGLVPTEETEAALKAQVRSEIGAIATPDVIHFTPSLPKTRSGKIMRRILRKIAEGEFDKLGDTSTLADPDVVDSLIETRREMG